MNNTELPEVFVEEVEMTIKLIKNGKVGGDDGIITELIRYAGKF